MSFVRRGLRRATGHLSPDSLTRETKKSAGPARGTGAFCFLVIYRVACLYPVAADEEPDAEVRRWQAVSAEEAQVLLRAALREAGSRVVRT